MNPTPHNLKHSQPRGAAAQRDRRAVQREARAQAVVFARWATLRGYSRAEAAEQIGVSPRTLAYWHQRWREDRLCAAARGRPCRRADVATRNQVIAFLRQNGPGLGLPTLRCHFPALARGELIDLQRRFRRVYRKRHRRLLHRLHWLKPGTVWAADHSQPPDAIEGQYPQALAIRDLASGQQLAWLPVEGATAEATEAVLEQLFREHGPPLVLKNDNGSAFIAENFQELLARWEVLALRSPALTPQYNGGCEASIGVLKNRTEEQATLAGRPGQWTSADLAAAQHVTNVVHRPFGHTGPSRAELWQGRLPITTAQRAALRRSVECHRETARKELGYDQATSLGRREQDRVDRVAIRRALVEHGYLCFRRRRITPPLTRQKVANIS